MSTVSEERGIQLADEMANFLNSCCMDDEVQPFLRRMERHHSTLQQGFTRLCKAWLLNMADRDDFYLCDERFKDSILLGRELKPILANAELPFI